MNNLPLVIPVIYLLIYWVGAFFIVYHLLKYGITYWPKRVAAVFLAGSIVLSVLSFMLFTQIDFQQLFDGKLLQSNNSFLENFKQKTQ
jgi:hypothetical protein